MFKWFKGEKKARLLDHPKQLRVGDMLTLKPRSIVPEHLQGETLTVEQVQSYQYSEGLVPEFVVRSTSGETLSLQVAEEEEGEYLTLAKKLSHAQVVSIFDQAGFSEVFGENYAKFAVNHDSVDEAVAPWLGNKYFQSVKEGVAYFYNEDKRQAGVSEYEDDGSEELRYHECEGEPDDYSLNIEIWEDGSTDVYAELSMPINVIEEMWPNGSA